MRHSFYPLEEWKVQHNPDMYISWREKNVTRSFTYVFGLSHCYLPHEWPSIPGPIFLFHPVLYRMSQAEP